VSDDAPVARQINLASRTVLFKAVFDVWRKSPAVGKRHHHVIYFHRSAAHNDPKLSETSFPPSDFDPVAILLEVGFPLA
jgi:hypothetical protein